MTDTTRRGFLAAAGAGGAAVAAAPAALGASSATRSSAAPEQLVAHVTDAASGTLSILVGEDEVQLRDRDLVARLRRAAGR